MLLNNDQQPLLKECHQTFNLAIMALKNIWNYPYISFKLYDSKWKEETWPLCIEVFVL